MRKGELRYGATQLECLAAVWGLDKLHFYLDGSVFTLVTDCSALKSLLTATWVNRHMLRWQTALQTYRCSMTIVHRAGKSNANADGPSRNALPNNPENPAADLTPDEQLMLADIQFSKGTRQQPDPIRPGTTSALFEEGEDDISPRIQIASVLIEQERAMYTADQSLPVAAVVLLDDEYPSVGTIMTSSLADSTHTAI